MDRTWPPEQPAGSTFRRGSSYESLRVPLDGRGHAIKPIRHPLTGNLIFSAATANHMMASLVVKRGWSTYKKRTRNKHGRNPVWSFFFHLFLRDTLNQTSVRFRPKISGRLFVLSRCILFYMLFKERPTIIHTKISLMLFFVNVLQFAQSIWYENEWCNNNADRFWIL